MSRSVTIATWNVQWRRSDSDAATIIRERLAVHQPDVICLTEAPADFLGGGGHTVLCDPDTGYPIIGNRRKVLLWSRVPWSEVDNYGGPGLPSGRFVAGTTETDLGPLRVIGVCIPWEGSHVSSGRRDRVRWEEHVRYLEALSEVLEQQKEPYVVVGDFNQAVPRRTAPREVFSSLVSNVANRCHLVTTGEIEGCGYAIDHIAVSDGLGAVRISGLPTKAENAPAVSDHFGLVAKIGLRG